MTIPANPPAPTRLWVVPTGGDQPPEETAPVSCAYCWEPIPAELFVDSPWTEGERSAQCPGCDLPVSLNIV
jgi:hypothetical protein